MIKNIQPQWILGAAMGIATFWCAGAPVDAQQPKDHPRLVSVQAARCTTCHDDLLVAGPVVHPAAEDDCTNCHEFTIDDQGSRVALVDSVPALCVICHDKEAEANGDVATPHYPVTDTCLNCHNPHSTEQPNLLLAAQPELCANCHDIDDLQEAHGGQLTAAVTCTSCHNPHGSENPAMLASAKLHPPFEDGDCTACHRQPFGERIRLQARGEMVCTACHGEMSEPDDASVHAAIHGDSRRAGCLSCHNPHMSERARLLLEPVPELCGECHKPILDAVRADTGHAAGEDCTSCHLPHSSTEPRLLTARPPALCGDCHDIEGEELTAKHLGADLTSLDCLACHSPHGTGNPSLLAETIHPPVLDGCDLCHEGNFNELMEDGESALCYACHSDIEDTVAEAEVPHYALELGPCTQCHNPHATAQASLIKAPAGQPCFDCHDDKAPEEGEVLHGVIELIGCQACHEPHGSANETLLRASGAQLCLSCHGPDAIKIDDGAEVVKLLGRFPVPVDEARAIKSLVLSADGTEGHPVAKHRVLGTPTEDELHKVTTTFSGELTCLTCHNPHKGRSQRLFRWEAASTFEACQHCHPK